MDYFPIFLSLKIAVIATVIVLIIGVPTARFLAHSSFRGKETFETLLILPMVLPPSVIGYGLLLLIGKRGPIGKLLNSLFGINLIFTWRASCIAAVVVALPLMYQSCKAAFLNIDPNYEKVARTLGANEFQIFFKISLPLAWPGILSGIAMSFARALGEFGATLMVAGNIPGKTQTIPLALYYAVENGDKVTSNILMSMVILSSFVLIYGLNKWLKSIHYN